MNITIRQALEAQPALTDLGKISFPSAISWRIGKILKSVNDAVQDYNEEKARLYRTLGTTEDGINFTLTLEQVPEVNQQLTELQKEEIEIKTKPFTVAEMGSKEIPGYVFCVEWLFVDEEEKEAAKGAGQ